MQRNTGEEGMQQRTRKEDSEATQRCEERVQTAHYGGETGKPGLLEPTRTSLPQRPPSPSSTTLAEVGNLVGQEERAESERPTIQPRTEVRDEKEEGSKPTVWAYSALPPMPPRNPHQRNLHQVGGMVRSPAKRHPGGQLPLPLERGGQDVTDGTGKYKGLPVSTKTKKRMTEKTPSDEKVSDTDTTTTIQKTP